MLRAQDKTRGYRAGLMAAASGAALVMTAPAGAGEAQAQSVEEIVVTGSRIVRDGYDAPTPVSVLGAEELAARAPLNIADAVNDLPAFAGSRTTHTGNTTTSGGTVGMNSISLRGLNANRTLVLLDGQRMVGSSANGAGESGAPNVNNVPNLLISRVDVVTGGASSAYGSDALAGVVNFVLDREFTGLKGAVSSGITTFGDSPNYTISLAGGTPFAGGRGHLLVSGEHSWNKGVYDYIRPWTENGTAMMANPLYTGTGGVPEFIIADHVGLGTAAPGGIITAGPLKGITFDAEGNPRRFDYGTAGVSRGFIQNGEWELTRGDRDAGLEARLRRDVVFLRTSYDIADNVSVFAQGHWGNSLAKGQASSFFKLAADSARIDNAFLPEGIRTQMTALGLTQIQLGRNNFDLPIQRPTIDSTYRGYSIGAEGNFDAAGTAWTWNAYYQRTSTHNSVRVVDEMINQHYINAIDSIRVNGVAVCRINADANPANDDPACVPFNYFGFGRNGADAINYIIDNSYGLVRLVQNVAAATVNGEPFSTWAGPVSVAMGVEHRSESLYGFASARDQADAFFSGNYKNSQGSEVVTEGFLETVVPLAANEPWARSLDLNAAVRATDYRTSGYVTTWKAGATWSPIEDIRVRATQSRDIRAPGLGDLFLGAKLSSGSSFDPFLNESYLLFSVVTGNLELRPEKADTTGLGVVLSPRFLEGFNASVDYYRINVKDAIAALSTQQIINQCFAGIAQLCGNLIRDSSGRLERVIARPENVTAALTKGLDIEASYNLPLASLVEGWDGVSTFRLFANRAFTNKTINPAQIPIEQERAGTVGGVPSFRYVLSVAYRLDATTVTLITNGINSSVYDKTNIECTTGCPVSIQGARTISDNDIDGITYFDLSLNHKFLDDGARSMEAYLVVDNITNKGPPPNAVSASAFSRSEGIYSDVRMGRTFRAGVRFQM